MKHRTLLLLLVTAAALAVVGVTLPLLHQYGQATRSPYSQQP